MVHGEQDENKENHPLKIGYRIKQVWGRGVIYVPNPPMIEDLNESKRQAESYRKFNEEIRSQDKNTEK